MKINGLQGVTHLNGQRGRVTDKMINTGLGRYPLKRGNGTLLSVKEENMIREGTRGAEGKHKGNERKELDQQRRRQRNLKKHAVRRHTGRKIRQINPTPGRDIKAS